MLPCHTAPGRCRCTLGRSCLPPRVAASSRQRGRPLAAAPNSARVAVAARAPLAAAAAARVGRRPPQPHPAAWRRRRRGRRRRRCPRHRPSQARQTKPLASRRRRCCRRRPPKPQPGRYGRHGGAPSSADAAAAGGQRSRWQCRQPIGGRAYRPGRLSRPRGPAAAPEVLDRGAGAAKEARAALALLLQQRGVATCSSSGRGGASSACQVSVSECRRGSGRSHQVATAEASLPPASSPRVLDGTAAASPSQKSMGLAGTGPAAADTRLAMLVLWLRRRGPA